MKMNRYVIILASVLALLSACGESLEDTYKKYAGDGEIRYLGKCTDLMASPGWQRIIVRWENNVDPAIEKVKIVWVLDEKRDSVMLTRGTEEYSISTLNGEAMPDGNYEISVSSVGSDGTTSIANTTFARPYTYDHEDIITFNQMINRLYVLNDRAVFFFAPWNDNITEATLSYTKKDGTAGQLELTRQFYDAMRAQNGGLFWLLEDAISPTGQFVLNRSAVLPDCNDKIDFEPHVFDTDKRYDSDFTQSVASQFGYEEIPDSWAETVQTVYLDMSLGSFSNFLNLPKLNKLVLGGRRYMLPESVNDAVYGQCSVADNAASDFVLKILNELNGLEVERYNKHFPTLKPADYLQEKGAPALPDVDFMDMFGMQFTEQPESAVTSGLPNLTDGNYTTSWRPSATTTFTAYTLTLDMGSPRTIHGLCFVQSQYSLLTELTYAPEYVIIKVSADGNEWKEATYTLETRLGKSNGEVNYIPFMDEVQNGTYRYVQLDINTTLYGNNYFTSIADIRLY